MFSRLIAAAFGLALVSVPALAQTTHCADSAGSLLHQSWQKEGGAFPGPGMLIGASSWTYQNVTLEEREFRVDEEPTPAVLNADFDEATKVVLESETNEQRTAGTETYAIKVNLTRLDGGPLVKDGELYALNSFVICTYSWNYLIP